MGDSGDRICGLVYRRVRRSRMVHELGAQARIRALCGLPDCDWNGGAGLGGRDAVNVTAADTGQMTTPYCRVTIGVS